MMIYRAFLFALGLTSVTIALAAEPSAEDLAERATLARSERYLQLSQPNILGTSDALAEAMDLNPALLNSSSVTGDATANAVFPNLGVIQPVQGATFALMSSGVAGASAPNHPEPGTNFGLPGNGGFDRTELTLTLDVPAGPGNLSFNYLFLSTEYPDFIQAGFNDNFVATLTDLNGTRVIAAIEVDNAAFFPASVDRAGGSGFDLFTEDPAGVDTVFGPTGLPDAGLTDFLLATASFESSGEITLSFAIQDVGDGILDSAVILDNLNVSNIEVVDVNRDFATGQDPEMLVGGSVSTDTSRLDNEAPARLGAAADGVTRLLLRTRAGSAGEVTFSIDGGIAPEDGGLDQPGGNQRLQSVTVPVDPSTGFGFAVYRTPDELNRGSDLGPDRSITLKSVFLPDSGGAAVEGTTVLKLVRPPLMFTHGLWSSPATWTLPIASEERFPVRKLTNYASTSASHFSTNSGVVPEAIREAIAAYHLQDVAATQVDAIGHSMGGLLSRIYTNLSDYERNDNFNSGDLRKLFTMDSPHTGSPLGDLLIFLRELPFGIGNFIAGKARDFGHPIDEGAIDDLAKHSLAIDAIQASPVPAHALVGIGGSDALELIPGKIGAFFIVINFFAATTGSELFEGLQHDAVVGRLSQEGGMPDEAVTLFGGGDGIHIGNGDPDGIIPGNTGSRLYSDRLIELLDTPVSDGAFSMFPAPAPLPIVEKKILDAASARLENARFSGTGLEISAPAPGTVVIPGGTVEVTVEVLPGFVVDEVLLVGPGLSAIDAQAPFTLDLQLPPELVGTFSISAVGSNSLDEFFESDPLELQAEPASMLIGLEIQPMDPILFEVGTTLQAAVLGIYDDDILRDLTSDPDTVFVSLDEEIVTISPAGLITAVSAGITTVLAQNESVQDSITVTVLRLADVFADGFESGDFSRWSSVVGAGTPQPPEVTVFVLDRLQSNGACDIDADCILFNVCTCHVDETIYFEVEATGDPDVYDFDWDGNGSFDDFGNPATGTVFTHVYPVPIGQVIPGVRARRGAATSSDKDLRETLDVQP